MQCNVQSDKVIAPPNKHCTGLEPDSSHLREVSEEMPDSPFLHEKKECLLHCTEAKRCEMTPLPAAARPPEGRSIFSRYLVQEGVLDEFIYALHGRARLPHSFVTRIMMALLAFPSIPHPSSCARTRTEYKTQFYLPLSPHRHFPPSLLLLASISLTSFLYL